MEFGWFDVLKLIGSLGVFIYGMKIMSEAIQKIAGKSLRMLLKKLTDNRFAGWLTGFVTTALIQSSSATTVMVVSFVNAGLLSVGQSIGVIMGANFGTTVTSWLISIFGFSNFKITEYALPVIAVGFILLFVPISYFSPKKQKSTGEFFLGFGLLFIGLEFMKHAVPDLKSNPEVLQFLSDFSDSGFLSTLLFVLIGTLLTITVQSSSAAMSITLVMVAQGWVPIEVGASMVLGENIGTTITAYLASLIGNVNAKRAARAHMVFNIIGVIWMVILLSPFLQLVDYCNTNWFGYSSVFNSDDALRGAAMPKALSLFHSGFNILNAILLIGFTTQIERLVVRWVKEENEESALKTLGPNTIIETPELAILEAKKELKTMGIVVKEMVAELKGAFLNSKTDFEKLLTKLNKVEEETDKQELIVSEFLMDVAQQNSSEQTTTDIIKMLEVASELENLGDLGLQLGYVLEKKSELDIYFKENVRASIYDLFILLEQSVDEMLQSFEEEPEAINTQKAEKLKREITELFASIKKKNFARLEKKEDKLRDAIILRDLSGLMEEIGEKLCYITMLSSTHP